MISLVEKFKQLIMSSHKSHTIICDIDDLLNYEEFQLAIAEEKYNIIKPKTGLELRIIFEKEVRNSKKKYLIIAPTNYKPLPDIDILVYFKSVSLKDFFPHLESSAIKGLNFNSLNLLFSIKIFEDLGYEQTIKFVLENIYNLDFDTLTKVKARERILNALIVVFLGKNNVNLAVSKFLTDLAKLYFPNLSKSTIDKHKLTNYLNEIWSKFVRSNEKEIDFEDPILNKNFGFLFLFEILKPIKVIAEHIQLIPKSLRVGVFVDGNENIDNELETLTQYLEQKIQSVEDSHDDWFTLIQILAKAKLKQLQTKNESLINNFTRLESLTNKRFQQFIDNIYWSLFSLSGIKKPIVVTRILDFVKAQPYKKKAIFVLDGMNYWQALLLLKELQKKGINVTPKTTLAYIPSITAWSRQAIFKGGKPILSEDNSKENSSFKNFWQQHNYAKTQIDFMKVGLYKDLDLTQVSSNTEILGIVCNDLDDMMHGITIGNKELKSSTEQWINESRIINGIESLKNKGYYICITSDHGNVCATGIKNLKIIEKVGTPSRSKRHLLFSNDLLQANFITQNPNLNLGVKDNSVFLRNEDAFTTEGTKIITHGGSHFWEVLIPFIEIK
jgi:hypothetical protein